MMVVTSRGEGADSESHWGSNFKGSKVRVVEAREWRTGRWLGFEVRHVAVAGGDGFELSCLSV